MRRPSGTWIRPRDTIDLGRAPWMGTPAKMMQPRDGRSRPEIARLRVDLPAPFEPTTATISPCCTVRSTPCRISAPPYPAWSPLTARTGSGILRRRAAAEIGLYHARIGCNGLRRTFRNDAALGQHQDLLGEAHDGLHDMLGENDCDAAIADAANDGHHVANLRWIEPCEHLVEQQQPWRDRKRPRELEPFERRDRQGCGGPLEMRPKPKRVRDLGRGRQRIYPRPVQ